MKAVEMLRAARELLSHKKRWCKTYYAKKENGDRTLPTDPLAVSFCAVGAVRHCGKHQTWAEALEDAEYVKAERVLDKAALAEHGVGIITLNDMGVTTIETVQSVFDKAIDLAAAE